jgi:small subunit ribosomal protein S1
MIIGSFIGRGHLKNGIEKYENENDSFSLDEGWWNAVLSDEEASIAETVELNCSPCTGGEAGKINWECAKTIYEQDQVILLKVTSYNRGGLLVEGQGIQGFIPVSHLVELPPDLPEDKKHEFLSNYENKSLYVKIIEFEPATQRLVFSERAAQAGEGKRKELFQQLKPGVSVCGIVTNITDFGVFVDLGGVEGLVHVSELSWGRVDKPSSLFVIGQQVKVMVLSINDGNSRIALSIKRLTPNPWDRVMTSYHPGDVISANVTTITRFGIFAKLKEGIEGLIHVSSLPELNGSHNLEASYSIGQEVKVKILHIDIDRRRLGLGLVDTE